MSCCAPITTGEQITLRLRGRDGLIREVWRYSIGWGWLLDGAEKQGQLGWKKRQRCGRAIDDLAASHRGEKALWLRFSAPSRPALLRSLNGWRHWRRDHGKKLDAVRVIDQGSSGERVWHVHVLGFGDRVDLEVEPMIVARFGGYGFIKAAAVEIDERRGYMLRRLRGYIGAKESGWRRLRVGVG